MQVRAFERYIPLYREKHLEKNIVENCWTDSEMIWLKWSLGDPLPKLLKLI